MTQEDKEFLEKINAYAKKVNPDSDDEDSEMIHVSEQLENLRPIMQEMAMVYQMKVEDVFIKYMDLQSEAVAEEDRKYKAKMGPDFDFKL